MKRHAADNGKMIQVDMKWKYSRPNPVYRCTVCGTILDSTQYKEMIDDNLYLHPNSQPKVRTWLKQTCSDDNRFTS